MSLRSRCLQTFLRSRALLARIPTQNILRRSFETRWTYTIWPQHRLLSRPSLFSPEVIRKFAEVIPIIALTGIAVVLDTLWILRLCFTRDDVRSLFTKKMAIDNIDYTNKDRPPVRKFIVIHDKYEWPPGLLDALKALRDPPEEGAAAEPADAKKKKKK